MPRCGTLTILSLVLGLGPSVLQAAAVRAWEGVIELPTYLPGPPDPNPPFPLVNRHEIYPYPMLDDLTDRREVKSYRALFLENDYLKATILPDVGGRLYSLYDKVGKREVFYRNHVMKYGLVALRGAWISGGVEFNFPNGHTTLTVSPVEARLLQNNDGSATAVVGATDWVTEMHWEVALTLRPGEARLQQHVTLFNSTPLENLYWYWANAAVPATNDMQFDYPMREANPHIAGEAWSYPVWKGVDYSWYKNIRQPTSLFGRQVHRNFFAAYYHNSDFGVVHVADYRQVPGKKIWSWGVAGDGLIWTDLLTDHDGPYNEIQSGRYETQLTQEFIPPRRVESWTEYWYPVQGLGRACVEATDSLALSVRLAEDSGPGKGGLEVAILPAINLAGSRVIIGAGDGSHSRKVSLHTPVDFRAGVVNRFVPFGPGDSVEEQLKTATVDITDPHGRTLLHWSAADPIDGNPDFVSAAGTHKESSPPEPHSSVEALFLSGIDQEKHGNEEGAVRTYGQVLERDSAYIPALIKLAWRSYRAADLSAAEGLIRRGLSRGSTDPQLEYAAGLIYRAEGRWTLAENAFWTSIQFGGARAPALAQLGEISIHEKQYDQAARRLQEALVSEPEDALTRADLAVALRLGGHGAEARKAVAAALERMPIFPLALAEAWRLHNRGTNRAASRDTTTGAFSTPFPRDVQYDLDVSAWYLRLGDLPSAGEVLRAARDRLSSGAQSPLLNYYLAYVVRNRGESQQADKLIALGSGEPDGEIFPNRIEDEIVLADAASHAPTDGHVASLLGTFLFAHSRYDEAARLWRRALQNGFDNSVLERNLGVYAWRAKGDLKAAAEYYAKAIQLEPDQYRLYPDLDEIYSALGNVPQRAQLFATAPASVLDHDVVRVRRALLLVEQRKFDQALEALSHHQFKPWEGGGIIREVYVLANLEKGRNALQARSLAEAEQDFRRALDYPENLGAGKPDRPANAQPLYWLGQALNAQGKAEPARASWREAAQEMAEGGADTRVYGAAALLRLGHEDEGRRFLAEAVAGADRTGAGATELYAAGLAEQLAGREVRARQDFQRALEVNPSYWQARIELERPSVSSLPKISSAPSRPIRQFGRKGKTGLQLMLHTRNR